MAARGLSTESDHAGSVDHMWSLEISAPGGLYSLYWPFGESRCVWPSRCFSKCSPPTEWQAGIPNRVTNMRQSIALEREKQACLAERLQRREHLALEELYDIYGPLCYSMTLRIVRNGGTAEDLVQETFLRVWKYAGSFDAQREVVGPWLMKVARNCALDHVRCSRERDDQGPDTLDQALHPNPLGNVEKNVAMSLGGRSLRTAMHKLNSQQRTVINLAYFEGYSQTEIAARLGHPLGTVKSWARAALKTLRGDFEIKGTCGKIRKSYFHHAE